MCSTTGSRPGQEIPTTSKRASRWCSRFLAQEELRRLNHFLCFLELDGLQGRAESMPDTGLHFDENNHAAIQDDKIEFARRATIVALDQLITFMFEITVRQPAPLLCLRAVCRYLHSWLK